jgi:predicted transcriptional regulator
MEREEALRLAIRCARDSLPPLRLAIIDDIAANPASSPREVRQRLDKPRTTVSRELESLHMLGVLTVDEVEEAWRGKETTVFRYSLADGIDPEAVKA